MSGTHLDLDALADILAGEAADPHAADCGVCAGRLAELRAAQPAVTGALAGLPWPELPADVAGRLDEALLDEGPLDEGPLDEGPRPASVTTLPARSEATGRRWLPAAAAAVLVLGGVGFAASQLGRPGADRDAGSTAQSTAEDQAQAAGPVRNDTGTEYGDLAALRALVPALVSGTAGSTRGSAGPAAEADDRKAVPGQAPPPAAAMAAPAPDPLARLRDDAGLADCLLALLPPDQPDVQALALDYGTYQGAPAMVVVLPSELAGRVDVFVVGPGCSRANDSTLFYTSAPAP